MATTNLRDGNIFQDFTVWVADIGMIGECPGFQPPELNIQTEEFRGGGMDGTVEIPLGIEKIEFEFDLHTWNPNVWQELGFPPGSIDVPVQFRGWMITPSYGMTGPIQNTTQKGMTIYTNCLIKSIKPAKIEPGKKAEMTVSCVANYYKQVLDGKTILEIDVFGKVTRIGSQDITAAARQFLF